MNSLILGFQYLLDGFSLIVKPGMKRFVIVPLFINILFFVGLFFVLRHYMEVFNVWFAQFLPAWLSWLATVLWILFVISFFLVFIFLFVTIANFISAPFNSFLAEKVELYLTGTVPEQHTLWEDIKDVPRIFGRQLAILAYYLPRAILLLLCFFIPVVQAFAPFFWFIFNAWNMAMTYVDYPSDNRRVPLSTVRAWMKTHNWTALGFGGGVLIAAMIPFLNLFVIPAAVAGATKFWVERFSLASTKQGTVHNIK